MGNQDSRQAVVVDELKGCPRVASTTGGVVQTCLGGSDMGKRNKLVKYVQPGNQYGGLTVVSVGREQVGKRVRPVAYCVRSDGTTCRVRIDHLAVGATRGAIRGDWNGLGVKHKGTYRSWCHMIDRCYNDRHPHFDRYGGRGISVCDRWKQSFIAFLEDMGDRPDGLTLERKDTHGNYEPENCIWATHQEQNRNKTNGTALEFNGETMSVTEWSERLGIDRRILFGRLRAGWSIERALTSPVRLRRWAVRPKDFVDGVI